MELLKLYKERAELDRVITFGGEEITLGKLLDDHAEYFNKLPSNIFSVGSDAKTVKGEKVGIKTAVCYMSSADILTSKTLCAFAELAGCKEGCLRESGHLGMEHGQLAMIRRTLLYLYAFEIFKMLAQAEIMKHSVQYGDDLAVRPNGTTDEDFTWLIELFPNVQFYDYTKILNRVIKNTLPNYDLTYSFSPYSAKSLQHGLEAIKRGYRVAVAFNTANTKGEAYQVPDTFLGHKLVSFDDHDARFLDAPNAIGSLTRKGSSVKTRQREHEQVSSFFVRPADIKRLAA